MSPLLCRWFYASVVVFVLLVWGNAAVAENLPPDTDGPTEVGVSLYIEDVSDINLGTETYDVTARLELRWHDPRLAFNPQDVGGLERQVWVGEQAEPVRNFVGEAYHRG